MWLKTKVKSLVFVEMYIDTLIHPLLFTWNVNIYKMCKINLKNEHEQALKLKPGQYCHVSLIK